MKTQELERFIKLIAESAPKHAKTTYEKHLRDFYAGGAGFLASDGDLQRYAFSAFKYFFAEYFSGRTEYEVDHMLHGMNVELMLALYIDLFCKRYQELIGELFHIVKKEQKNGQISL